MADALKEILRSANKHPNSRVSKLIHTVEENPTQKNIVLLLIELADHAEYSLDFDISLKYYLDLFLRLGINHDMVLNEAGILLINSSKIYSKRVDYVQSLVEGQILTLSNADDELQKQKLEHQENNNAAPIEKPKKSRKRALDVHSDPYEIELAPKKFKKLAEEKRFAVSKTFLKNRSVLRNIEMEPHIHPAGWLHATIYDLENEEDVDTKRNYKLFTYHVEHRYNTLVPDINFRLHFKMKDYMDEQEEMEENEACTTDRSWPPLSEAYVQKYLRLENFVLQQDVKTTKRKSTEQQEKVHKLKEKVNKTEPCNINERLSDENFAELEKSMLDSCAADTSLNSQCSSSNQTQRNFDMSNINGGNDSALGQSILDETNNTQLNSTMETARTENVNKSNLAENDIVLEASSFDRSRDSINISQEDDNLTTTTNKGLLNDSNVTECDNSLTVIENQQENDSALGASVLDQTSNIESNNTVGVNANLEAKSEIMCEKTTENGEILDTTMKLENEKEPKTFPHVDVLAEDMEKSQSSVFFDEDIGKNLNIDDFQEKDKTSTQIRVHLPCTDDEGVYLSDLEELDGRLLSAVVKTPNILPGVKAKNLTIILDDELREALEMRDGIMEHFSQEVYKIPVINEAKKETLIFNILKLPANLLRRKVLFKLGPDMDLYIKARSARRLRPETVVSAHRNSHLQQRGSLKNTDMTDVWITPPNSPENGSQFFGFSDSEDDTISCTEFCGFTEEEQSTLMMKHISRLSRDSGVGVDTNIPISEKETMEIVFQGENSEGGECEENLKSDSTQITESILRELPSEIRRVLATALEETSENNNCTTTIEKQDSEGSGYTEQTKEESLKSENSRGEETSTSPMASSSTDAEREMEILCKGGMDKDSENVPAKTVAKTQSADVEIDSEGLNKKLDIESTDTEMSFGVLFNTEQSVSNGTLNFEDDATLDLDTQGNKTKIQKWHEHLQPILAKSRERHHFDVYNLGTEIIDTIKRQKEPREDLLNEPESTSLHSCGPIASFNDVMDNKDRSLVSRYFLSTLMLANQSNIDILTYNKTPEKPSSWHDINLKLLSTKRHTVDIEDNIGMIDKSHNSREKCMKRNPTEVATEEETTRENEEELLEQLHSNRKSYKQLKSPLKRSGDNVIRDCTAEKKPKDPTSTINSRRKVLPNLIQNVQIIAPSCAMKLPSTNTMMLPAISHQPCLVDTDLVDVNIRTVQSIEKVQKRSDDLDSGIFSIDEISTS